VRSISRAVRLGKDDATLLQELTAQCDKAPGPRRNICTLLVPDQISAIKSRVTNTSRPDAICEAIGFARPFARTRLIAPDQCERFVDLARSEAKVTGSEGASRKVDLLAKAGFLASAKACKSLEQDQRVACQVVLRLVLRGLQSDLDKGVDSGSICQKMHDRHLIKLVRGTTASSGEK
jgi:hypothetical protein